MAIQPRGNDESRAYGKETILNKHVWHDAGMGKSFRDAYEDVDRGFRNAEGRVDYPELDALDGAQPGAAAATDVVLKGRNLLQGQTFDAHTNGTGTSEIVLTALKPGKTEYTVTYENTGSITVTLTGTVLAITFNAGVSTANAIATAVNADGADTEGIIRAVAGGGGGGGTGTTVPEIATAEAFAGGVGKGWECRVAGVEALPANETGDDAGAKITDTQATVTVPALGAAASLAATDLATAVVKSGEVHTQQLTCTVQV